MDLLLLTDYGEDVICFQESIITREFQHRECKDSRHESQWKLASSVKQNHVYATRPAYKNDGNNCKNQNCLVLLFGSYRLVPINSCL